MEIQFFKVKAALQICSKTDLYDSDGYFFEEKDIFLKNICKQEFAGFYKMPMDYPMAMKGDWYYEHKNYWNSEIQSLLQFQQLYKLASSKSYYDFNFELIVKNAKKEDLIHGNNEIKNQKTYYLKSDDSDGLIGPYLLDKTTSLLKIAELIENKKIFVLSKKQLFEPIVTAKSA